MKVKEYNSNNNSIETPEDINRNWENKKNIISNQWNFSSSRNKGKLLTDRKNCTASNKKKRKKLLLDPVISRNFLTYSLFSQ